ncbi:MAG: OmpH family outer membrane protein [Sphingopyxis terrae]|jgi:Skp family chaperone for outer membrane proteins|nr:MAG: OmpH family outer membrane protein [Sphingopyxis terrae]
MINRLKFGFAVLAVAAVAAFGAVSPTLAQATRGGAAAGATSIGIIDMQRIIRDAAAFRDARTQLERFRATYQSEITRDEERLRKEDEELGRQRAVLSPDAFDKRRTEFERKVMDVQRRMQDRSVSLEQSFDKVRGDVGRTVIQIVTEMVSERGYSLVLDKSQVVFHATDMEITDEVLRRLDQKMPTVKVAPPGGK